MTQAVTLDVNGTVHQLSVDDPDMPLLYALRDELGLDNPRFGCGLAQCGACTVHVGGVATRSCVTPLSSVEGRLVVTMAGLGTPDRPHALQTAFAEAQATQCGYCMNGMIMTLKALLLRCPAPTEQQIRNELDFNLCRCGTHVEIMRCALRAVELTRGDVA